MKTIKIIALAAALTASMPAFAQETQRLTANKHNEYGLIYSLPKTHVNIEVEAVRTVKKAGPYYRYAEKYLGVKNPITEDSQTWAVKDVQMSAFGVPDKDSEWLMKFKAGSSPFVVLDAAGLPLAINTDPEREVVERKRNQMADKSVLDGTDYSSVFTEDMVASESLMKRAETAAAKIFELRESRNDLVSGNADQMPPDGASLKLMLDELNRQEQTLTAMFVGTTQLETRVVRFDYEPKKDVDGEVVFRVSDVNGIVDSNDLSGEPVYITVKTTQKGELPVDDKGKEKELPKGAVMYNIPGLATVTLTYDGNVLAMVGGLGEKTKSLSLNRAYSVTRQTGSTIKPIGAYALGIEYGLVNWSTMLNNSPLYLKQDMVIRDEDYCRKNGLMGLSDTQLKAYPNAWRSWPRNYGGNYGDNTDIPLWNGLARSLNTIAIRVGDLVGASNIFNFVYNTLQLNTLDPTSDVGLAQMVMGSQTHGVTPTALAAAFQIFYDGEYTTPHLYTRVLDRDGNIYLENNATSYQALTPQTAYVMNRLLKNVLFSSVGTASGRYPNSNGMESFGKTGTASDEKDLWFVGGTPYYVTAVWWGYDAPYDMTNTLSKDQAKTRTCVMAWKAYMEQVQANLPYKAFPAADGVVERAYCTQSGLLAGPNCPSRATGYYRADDLPDTCNYSHSSGIVAQTVEPDTTNLDTD